MRTFLLTLLLLTALTCFAQDITSLFECHEAAVENHPLAGQKELIISSHDLTRENINSSYYPSASINAQAHWQSEVTKIPFEGMPGMAIEELDNDMYKATLDINQLIYDGGMTGSRKALEASALKTDLQELEVELYVLKERVNRLYFSILLAREKIRILDLEAEVLESRLREAASAVSHGVMLAADKNMLEAGLLKVQQSKEEASLELESLFSMISELTGLDISENTILEIPFVPETGLEYINRRPETDLFGYRLEELDARKKTLNSSLRPSLAGFGQAGYGRPGLNMLENKFDDFYVIGARLTWRFWDWHSTKREKQILDLNREMINRQKETFDKNLLISAQGKSAEIRKMAGMLETDVKLIELRESITKTYASQLENGIITASDYLAELNAEMTARMDMEIHRIRYAMAKVEYLTITGNINRK